MSKTKLNSIKPSMQQINDSNVSLTPFTNQSMPAFCL
uniref:Uncharacterized protein n=1 Tax=Solanum lycopersicum TaxID=4081 RepID=A0A3Q7GV69_SOLLC